jgi:hypothetical protein
MRAPSEYDAHHSMVTIGRTVGSGIDGGCATDRNVKFRSQLARLMSTASLLAAMLLYPIFAATQITPLPEPVSAIWRTQTIEFRFRTERQRFRCEELAARLIRIVNALGAHLSARTQLHCTDGLGSGITGDLVIISPIEATNENLQRVLNDITAVDKLAARLNRKPDPATKIRVFPAHWTAVSSKQSKLDAADCELLKAVEQQLLPALMLRDAAVSAACSAYKIPTLTAVALVRVDGTAVDASTPPSPAGTLAAECTQVDAHEACEDAGDEAIDPVVLPAG